MKCFLSMAQITQILLFSGMNVLERSKITVQQRLIFKKIFCNLNFKYVSNLRGKSFSEAPVMCVFLYGSNNSDSVVLRNVGFGEIKDHSSRAGAFQKYFLL